MPQDLSLPLAFLLNTKAGGFSRFERDSVEEAIRERCSAHGIDPILRWSEPASLLDDLDALKGEAGTVIVAGGDGTVAASADSLSGTQTVFGVLPFGTMNLVARDLDVADWAPEAVDRLLTGRLRTVDVARVNGQVFMHSAVMGTFPDIARHREAVRDGDDILRWPRFVMEATRDLATGEAERYTLTVDDRRRSVETRSLIVSNNKIDNRLDIGVRRSKLDRGLLYCYVHEARGSVATLGVMVRFLLGLVGDGPKTRRYKGRELVIDAAPRTVKVSLDGEVRELETPLRMSIDRRALTVLTPRP